MQQQLLAHNTPVTQPETNNVFRFSLTVQITEILELRGGRKKKLFFSSEKLRNSETPPPPSSSLEGPVFSDKEILESARPPPPFGEKFRNILSFL